LLRLANATELEPFDLLADIDPYNIRDSDNDAGERARLDLRKAVLEVVERRAVSTFISRLSETDLVVAVAHHIKGGRFVLREASPLWQEGATRDKLRTTLGSGESTVADNLTDLLRYRVENSQTDAAKRFFLDKDLLTLLWAGATHVAPNVRRFQSFRELRASLTSLSGADLPDPSWWERKQAQFAAIGGGMKPNAAAEAVTDAKRGDGAMDSGAIDGSTNG
jgi:hypothetical protein